MCSIMQERTLTCPALQQDGLPISERLQHLIIGEGYTAVFGFRATGAKPGG